METKKCEVCGKKITQKELKDSEEIIGGNRYFCNTHLNKKMGW